MGSGPRQCPPSYGAIPRVIPRAAKKRATNHLKQQRETEQQEEAEHAHMMAERQ